MTVKIVTYDLNKEKNGEDRKKLLAKIKSFDWAMLSESCYAVDSHHSPKQFYDLLTPFLDSNDRIFIDKLSLDACWCLEKSVSDWLSQRS